MRTDVFVGNEVVASLAVISCSCCFDRRIFYLNSVRDLDAGFIPAGKGREHASLFADLFGFT